MRTLAGSPATSIVALLTLALGIGANSSLFSLVNGVLLRPLPYPSPDELVTVLESNPGRGFPRFSVAPPNFEDWRRQARAFSGMAAMLQGRFNLSGAAGAAGSPRSAGSLGGGDERPEAVSGARVTPEFFRVLGVPPVHGRGFLPEEGRPGGPRVAVLADGIWRRRFGSDLGLLGRTIAIDGESFTVVGVMPPGFDLPGRSQIWMPLPWDYPPQTRGGHFLDIIGRLKAGRLKAGRLKTGRLSPEVALRAARAEMKGIAARLEREYPDSNQGWTAVVIPLHEALVEDVRPALLLLLGAVTFVLFIACANVANLLLALLAAREREMAVRAALGAGRARLVRQMVTESLVLFLAGGALGLLLAAWTTRILVALYGEDLPRREAIGLDGRVLLFTLAVSLATGLVFGLAPALSATRGGLFGALKEGGRGVAGGARGRLVRRALVVAEVAVALLLLVGAGLLLRSFARLRAVDPGFRPRGVLTAELALPPKKYSDAARRIAFTRVLLERLRAIPGVRSADTVVPLPLGGEDSIQAFLIQGQPEPPPGQTPTANVRIVTPGFFRALGIPLLRGRAFTPGDDETSVPVIVVNPTLAERTWPGENPIGKRITFGGMGPPSSWSWDEVVGVVAEIRHQALDREAGAEIYRPQLQKPIRAPLSLLLKAEGDPVRLAGPLRAAVRAIDGDLPVERVRTLESVIAGSLAGSRFQTVLLGLLAGVALLLAGIGVYGVVSTAVTERTHEIGIRMALGARRSEVLVQVVRQGMAAALAGTALGLAAALLLLWKLGDRAAVFLSGLPGGRVFDPLTLVAVPLLLLAVALLANWLPARRATRVDPLVALRSE